MHYGYRKAVKWCCYSIFHKEVKKVFIVRWKDRFPSESINSSQPHLEELDSDTGEHELQQRRDDHDVPDGPDGHKHTLDHMLQDEANKNTPSHQRTS